MFTEAILVDRHETPALHVMIKLSSVGSSFASSMMQSLGLAAGCESVVVPETVWSKQFACSVNGCP